LLQLELVGVVVVYKLVNLEVQEVPEVEVMVQVIQLREELELLILDLVAAVVAM
jgi:hypothetical protein